MQRMIVVMAVIGIYLNQERDFAFHTEEFNEGYIDGLR
jgi:hypothetical protein